MFFSFTKTGFRRTAINWFLLVFVVTAFIGAWAAYDSNLAWRKLWFLIGAVLIYYLISLRPFSSPRPLIVVCCTCASVAAGYFLFTNDWTQTPASLSPINSIALRWMEFRPAFNGYQLDPNAAEGTMALLLPLILAQGVWALRCKKWFLTVILALVACFVVSGLFFSTSRGAWVSSAVGLSVWTLWAIINRQKPIQLSNKFSFIISLAVSGLILIFILLIINNFVRLPHLIIDSERVVLAQETADLIADFPFTGGGLNSFPGLYSQYILIIPFLYSTHSHNLFLNIALEQGLVGLWSFCGILFFTLWLLLQTSSVNARFSDKSFLPLFIGSLFASITVLTLYGLIDDPYYSTEAVLLLFVIPGLVVSLHAPENKSIIVSPRIRIGLVVAALVALFSLFVFRNALLAAFQADLGAVAMSKVELQTWPIIEWNDERNLVFLEEAEDRFGKVLTYNPANRTARQRLGSIAMLRGDYDEAISHLEVANEVDPDHRGVRKTLGYSYVWVGEIDSALRTLAEIPEAEEELKTYTWWWGTKGRDDLVVRADTIVTEMAKQGP